MGSCVVDVRLVVCSGSCGVEREETDYHIYGNVVQSESTRRYRVNGLTVNKCLLASSICVTSRPVRAIFTSSSHT